MHLLLLNFWSRLHEVSEWERGHQEECEGHELSRADAELFELSNPGVEATRADDGHGGQG